MNRILTAACLALSLSVPAVAQEPLRKMDLGLDKPAGGEAKPGADAKPARPPLDVSKMPFNPDSIKRVVGHHMDKIQACYEETLAGKEKAVEGSLMTSFTIDPEGMVRKAKVEKKGTTLHDPKLHECVVATLISMEFPKPSDGAPQPIQYPFNLKAIH